MAGPFASQAFIEIDLLNGKEFIRAAGREKVY